MSTDFRVLLGSIMSMALIAGCALEMAEPEETDLGTTQSELRWRRPLPPPNPCFVTSCPTGTTCEVQDGEAVCVPQGGPVEETCGDTTCSPGTLCCNASCGICLPPGRACIQIACN